MKNGLSIGFVCGFLVACGGIGSVKNYGMRLPSEECYSNGILFNTNYDPQVIGLNACKPNEQTKNPCSVIFTPDLKAYVKECDRREVELIDCQKRCPKT